MTTEPYAMGQSTAVVWFRRDLRIEDNPALNHAVREGLAIVPLYIWSPEDYGDWAPGGASKWWLHYALESLREALDEIGLKLIIRRGSAEEVLPEVAKEAEASAVFWNRLYDPAIIERDSRIKQQLKDSGLTAESFNGALLNEPHAISNKSGKPFRVFTPYYKHVRQLTWAEPEPLERAEVRRPTKAPKSDSIEELGLLPKVRWDKKLEKHWEPTLKGAQDRLRFFHKSIYDNYTDTRNLPGIDGTSKLSPYLHAGQLSPRQVYAEIYETSGASAKLSTFGSELCWREFAYHLLYHFPHLPEKPLMDQFADFPWEPDKEALRRWQQGRTGYPIVDAGMRQLWETGWMHNRVRMVVGSLLVKHLLQPWQDGEAWFWDCLVDADLASNTMGWQWVAGCGADASPYFRVFNPMTQGSKFDEAGDYVREYVPELADLPDKYIHEPWEAPDPILRSAGVKLGDNYPNPIINHREGRQRALDAYETIKKSK